MVNLAAFSFFGLAALFALAGCSATPHSTNTAAGANTVAEPAAMPAAERIHLWDQTPGVVAGKESDTDPTEPTLDIYLPPHPNGKAMLVLPGGGYTHLATGHEGKDVATFLNDHDITAFVLRYRHAPRYHYPVPLQDAQRAMRLIRSRADQYHIDPHKLGVVGFSAGGHLAASLATAGDDVPTLSHDSVDMQNARPDFAALIYPVITFVDEAHVHKGSRTAFAGDDKALWQKLSAENRVTPSTPPIFLVHSAVDKTVPVENSLLFFEACRKAHVSVEMHIFPSGPHGFGMRKDPMLSIWPEWMLHWINTSVFAPHSPATRPAK